MLGLGHPQGVGGQVVVDHQDLPETFQEEFHVVDVAGGESLELE